MDISDRVLGFISEELVSGDRGRDLDARSPLLNGLVDSGGLMQLIMFLEDEYAIEIGDGEISPEHFGTAADVAALVAAKVGTEAASSSAGPGGADADPGKAS